MADDRYPMLAPDYLEGLESRPVDDVRAMRTECVAVETSVSYVRRMVQGRLDIVQAEQRRRAEGGSPADIGELIGRLPEILGEGGRPPGFGRLPQSIDPPDPDPELTGRLEAIAGSGHLTSLADLTDDQLQATVDELQTLEHDVSARRRELFERIDALQSEITRRYRSGEVSVESLLGEK